MAKLKQEKLVAKSEMNGRYALADTLKRAGMSFQRTRYSLKKRETPIDLSKRWLDNCPIHRAKTIQALFPEWAAKGLHIHFLAPYSPELNRIEILGRQMKRLRPFVLLEVKALRAALRQILASLSRKS